VTPPSAGPAAEPPDAATAAAGGTVQASGLAMELSPRAPSWVSVNTDGEQVFSGMMKAGEKRLVTAKEQIALSVGDAGAFAYTLNGRAGKPLGAPGEVVSTRITLANLQEFLTP
jgi:cytoskeleton protein RodZ